MPIVTPDDLAALLGREFSDAEDAQAQAALDLAVDVVGAYLPNVALTAVEGATVDLQGTWARTLTLPKQPVTAVTDVALNGSTLVEGVDWVWLGRDVLHRGSVADDVDATPLQPLPGAADGGVGHWGGPRSTVTVTYSFGPSAPAGVRMVLLQVARRLFSNPEGVRMEMLGGYQVQYANSDGVATLTPDEQAVLRQYRRRAW